MAFLDNSLQMRFVQTTGMASVRAFGMKIRPRVTEGRLITDGCQHGLQWILIIISLPK
jgi:hypothetical protein